MQPIQIMFSRKTAIKCWTGEYGTYIIPSDLEDVKMSRRHYPDRRYKRAAKFMAWVAEMERATAAGEMIGIPVIPGK